MKSHFLHSGLLGMAGLASAGHHRYLPSVGAQQMTRRTADDVTANNQTVEVLPPRYRNIVTEKFYVDGKKLPLINWDVGESYAGNLPISDKKDEKSEQFFWYFPTATKEFVDKEEIVIWLNGGPGCSSLTGFLEENGPISWSEGMIKPQRNPFSWHLLTNMVWLEQPIGVGFTKGNETIHNEDDIAKQFIGFWKNFAKTFGMEDWKVYIAGESYAGMYGPYLAKHMLDQKDKKYYDMSGLLVYDGLSFGGPLQVPAVAFPFLDEHYDLMPVDQPSFDKFRQLDKSCGLEAFRRDYYVYPPKGPVPTTLPYTGMYPDGSFRDKACENLFVDIGTQAHRVNPCFSYYNIMDRCPKRNNPLLDDGGYYNRRDVQSAIHVEPHKKWEKCTNVFASDPTDHSAAAGEYAYPQVIDATKNVIIAHGALDFLLPLHGVLLGIQNMTWGGKLGFQQAPRDPFYVPAYGFDVEKMDDEGGRDFYGSNLPAAYGVMGTTHAERGLSFVVTELAGHQGPEFTPAASFRILEKLLGRIDSLSQVSPFSLPQISNIAQPKADLGNGTVQIPYKCIHC